MAQYLVSIHHPEHFDSSSVSEETMRDIGALNKEMMAAGVRFFAGGLQSEAKAKSLRARRPLKEGITQYLAAGHLPANFDPSSVTEAIVRDMGALTEEMEAKGVTVFAGGLYPASDAKSLRAQPGGKVLVTDGPYLETKEHLGGLTILEAADMDEALAWGRKGALAGRASCEVRPFFRSNTPAE